MAGSEETPDLCVIGGGSGGLSVAAAAAAFGVPVILIERGNMGGDCLNSGCVPSKALLSEARRAWVLREAFSRGATGKPPDVDFAAVQDYIQEAIATIAPHDSVERFTRMGVEVIRGAARFVDRHRVEVNGRLIKARRTVIATGSRARIPPIPGIDECPFLTNETVFELVEQPKSLVVLGCGPIGLEMAQAFHRLGTEVQVVEPFQPLAKEDPELAQVVLECLGREGLKIELGWQVDRVSGDSHNGVSVHLVRKAESRLLQATHLLVATGRRPNTEDLNLEAAGINFSAGGIEVDAGLLTSNRKVFAIGDVAGGFQFTHVAANQAGIVIRRALFRLPARFDSSIVPWCTFTDPEIGWAGLSVSQARDRFGDAVHEHSWQYQENDRAVAEGDVRGLVKLVTGRSGRILGGGVVGANAGELINFIALCLAKHLSATDVASYISPYPTRTEMIRRAAVSRLAPGARNPWVRRVISVLRCLG